MKKILLGVIVGIFLVGCNQLPLNSNYKTYNRNGISFQYPNYLSVSEDENAWTWDSRPNRSNITVTKNPISKVIKDCLNGDGWEEKDKNIKDIFSNGLSGLKTKGMNEHIYRVDTIGCLGTSGNLQASPIKINELNGVIFTKCECQESGELDAFLTQLLVIDPYDQVYTVTFNFDFGEIKDYLEKLRNKNELERGYPSSQVGEDNMNLWDEVNEFLTDNKPIKSSEVKAYEDNFEVIKQIINTVQISN